MRIQNSRARMPRNEGIRHIILILLALLELAFTFRTARNKIENSICLCHCFLSNKLLYYNQKEELMSSENRIPVLNEPVNMMEGGANSSNLAISSMRRHPIDELQQHQASRPSASFWGTGEEEDVRRLYGSGFAMKLATERRMANTMGSIVAVGGITSTTTTNLMSDISTGRDQTIEFHDTLGLPGHRPVMGKVHDDPHTLMERKLGM